MADEKCGDSRASSTARNFQHQAPQFELQGQAERVLSSKVRLTARQIEFITASNESSRGCPSVRVCDYEEGLAFASSDQTYLDAFDSNQLMCLQQPLQREPDTPIDTLAAQGYSDDIEDFKYVSSTSDRFKIYCDSNWSSFLHLIANRYGS